MSTKPKSGQPKPPTAKDWRTKTPYQQHMSRGDRDASLSHDAPTMSRSRVQLATAYAPDTLFTWEGAKGICRAVPIDRPAEIKSATEAMIFEGIKESAETWQERALSVREPATIPMRLVLDGVFFDEQSDEVVPPDPAQFRFTRPDRIGYIPYPLLYRCGHPNCGRLHECDSVNDQARHPLPRLCTGHEARWTQVDVVYVHWSGRLEPLSPFLYQHVASTGEVARIDRCQCGSREFRLRNEAPVFSEWKFVCLGCGDTRDLKQADPTTLAILKPRMDRGEKHEWIEINMLPVSYRANSAYYVQKGYFINFEDRKVVDLMKPSQRQDLLRTLAGLHGFPFDEPSATEIEKALKAAGKISAWDGWKQLKQSAQTQRDLGQIPLAEKIDHMAHEQRESWFIDETLKRGNVQSPALILAATDRTRWARRFDPIRLTIEHQTFLREHIQNRMPKHEAVDVLNPDRLLSEAAGDPVKLQDYQSETGSLLTRMGFTQMVLIRGLPICEYSFGYSRVSAGPVHERENGTRRVQMPVKLNAFPRLPDNKRPIYVLEQRNEAIYVRLDPQRVRRWLIANQVSNVPASDKPGIAGAYLEQYADFGAFLQRFKGHEGRSAAGRELPPYIYLLIHSLAHQVTHALCELSGLDRDGIGEHIFPADLAFVVYRKGMTPDLGNISAMWRNHSAAFLQRILEPRMLRCGSGSLCDSRGGACPACLMLPEVTCIAGNQLLSRAALKGGPPPTWEQRRSPPLTGYFDPTLAP